jgi:hypothetical protein
MERGEAQAHVVKGGFDPVTDTVGQAKKDFVTERESAEMVMPSGMAPER